MDFTSKEDQSRTQMKIIEIDTNKTSNFDLPEYQTPMKAAK